MPISQHTYVTPLFILNFFKKLTGLHRRAAVAEIKGQEAEVTEVLPKVYARSEHNISRTMISDNALKVLYRLRQSGYQAYLVGGCVRDLLLGREPKDFDVVTDAHPEELRAVFRNCRLIGRRFRLAHVHFGNEIIEVATFRALTHGDEDDRQTGGGGRILRDNVYGSIEEDAWRRDFAVNALYYNIKDFSVVDYVGGMDDHRAGVLRLIGDPDTRYREDPVRMLRAVRFAVKLGFTIHPDCAKNIPKLAYLLKDIPSARLHEEVIKLFFGAYAVQTFEQLRHYHLFEVLFPDTEVCLAKESEGFPLIFLIKALEDSDKRIQEGKTVSANFLFAALLWEPVRLMAEKFIAAGVDELPAYQNAAAEVVERQIRRVAIPRSISQPMREIWLMQPRFARMKGLRPFRLLTHPWFRASYDFLLLRAASGEAEPAIAEWWTKFQIADGQEQKIMARDGLNYHRTAAPRSRRKRSGKSSAKTAKQVVVTPDE